MKDEDVLQHLPVGTTATFYFRDLGAQISWVTVGTNRRRTATGRILYIPSPQRLYSVPALLRPTIRLSPHVKTTSVIFGESLFRRESHLILAVKGRRWVMLISGVKQNKTATGFNGIQCCGLPEMRRSCPFPPSLIQSSCPGFIKTPPMMRQHILSGIVSTLHR